ncbi:MAG: tetratricopeptide repeat protein [Candidatus Omnitrophica bacterium]|nr:tetratricopeptide repeat protein [Candidatus Omnitrophota bacterium]
MRYAGWGILFALLAGLITWGNFRARNLPDSEQFEYQYVQIHNPFFVREQNAEGEWIYRNARPRSVPSTFPAVKSQNERRIFVVGGSVARWLETKRFEELLKESHPTLQFRIINCGMTSYDSYRESLVQKELLHYEPDLIILFSGNNEFFNPVRLNLILYRLNKALSTFASYTAAQEMYFKLKTKLKLPSHFGDPNTLRSFERNINRMLRGAYLRGVPMAVCTLPTNFRDCPPRGNLPLYKMDFVEAWLYQSKGELLRASKLWEAYVKRYPDSAHGYFQLARSQEELGLQTSANSSYIEAVRLDSRGRCTPEKNEMLRRLAQEQHQILVDLEDWFGDRTPTGLPGGESLSDECHWWPDLGPQICEQVLGAVKRHDLSFSNPVLEEKWYQDKSLPPERSPEEIRRERAVVLAGTSAAHGADKNSERGIFALLRAHALDPDVVTKERLEIWIPYMRNSGLSEERLQNIKQALPWYAGEAYRRTGNFNEAQRRLLEALAADPMNARIHFSLALLCYTNGDKPGTRRALETYSAADAKHPSAEAYFRLLEEVLGPISNPDAESESQPEARQQPDSSEPAGASQVDSSP